MHLAKWPFLGNIVGSFPRINHWSLIWCVWLGTQACTRGSHLHLPRTESISLRSLLNKKNPDIDSKGPKLMSEAAIRNAKTHQPQVPSLSARERLCPQLKSTSWSSFQMIRNNIFGVDSSWKWSNCWGGHSTGIHNRHTLEKHFPRVRKWKPSFSKLNC